MSDSPELNVQLKKRARRRLVGAIAVAGLAAVVLPMVMDEEPKQQIQDVQIRIPGQNEAPFTGQATKPGGTPEESARLPALSSREASAPAEAPPLVEKPVESKGEAKAEHKSEKPVEKVAEKVAEKPAPKAPEKVPAKVSDKSSERPAKADEGNAHANNSNGQYLILIGAFANPANVKQLQTKIGELGIKVITEPLDSPDGKKTRVRAGPFTSREAADKALERIKRIGVSGVVAAKQ